LLAAADQADARPLWVSVWGGANTLAQALHDARRERSPANLQKLVSKLRVYTISDQDDAGPWLRREFPGLCYIVSPSTTDWKEYWRATWTGISGDRHYKNGPRHRFDLVDNPWLEENIIKNHGPLGALYPKLAYIMEGDTPSFLGLVDNGLGWAESPSFGGWGGRYAFYHASGETRPIWTNNQDSRDTVTADNGQTVCSDQATVWRWREHFQNDFAARMDWCVAGDSKKANHNPVAVLNGDRTKRVLELAARSGETVTLSAAGSGDPDGHALATTWFVYPEAGTFIGEVKLSATSGDAARLVAPGVKQPAAVERHPHRQQVGALGVDVDLRQRDRPDADGAGTRELDLVVPLRRHRGREVVTGHTLLGHGQGRTEPRPARHQAPTLRPLALGVFRRRRQPARLVHCATAT